MLAPGSDPWNRGKRIIVLRFHFTFPGRVELTACIDHLSWDGAK
jgi:hypothetical protein